MSHATDALPPERSMWTIAFEKEFWLLLLLGIGCYFTRLSDLSIRGEESRRGRIAWEMIHHGDWLVPRVQGLPRLSRPPLQYWMIALVGMARGDVDAIAVRLPSAVATLMTILLVYVTGRTWMSSIGALGSAVGFATFAQILLLGRLGETEAIFTFLLSSSLLVWQIGTVRGWSPWLLWLSSCSLAALATLAKGPQAPVYFFGGISAYLWLTGNLKSLLSRAPFCGMAVFLGLVSAWQIPFTLKLGQEKVSHVYLSEVAKRFTDDQLSTFLSHLVLFPLEVLLGCLLPWSLLGVVYLKKGFWKDLGDAKKPLLFLLSCICVAFPTVWIPPEAKGRYFMPLFPCFALLSGFAVEKLAQMGRNSSSKWMFIYRNPRTSLFAVASSLGLIFTGPILSQQAKNSPHADLQVQRVKELIPPGKPLYSFGVVHHLFSYHFADDVIHRSFRSFDSVEEVEYFCVDAYRGKPRELPFEWEVIARVNCDRIVRSVPENEVLLGRRTRHVSQNRQSDTRRKETTESSAIRMGQTQLRTGRG